MKLDGLWIFVLALALLAAYSDSNAQSGGSVGPLVKLLESGRVPAERQGMIVEMICTRGGPEELAVVFGRLQQPDALPRNVRLKTLELLADAAVTRKTIPAGDLSPLVAMLGTGKKDQALQRGVIRLASVWKLKAIVPELERIAASDSAPPELQQVAIEGLASSGDPSVKQTLVKLAREGKANRARIRAAAALAQLDVDAAAQQAAAILPLLTAKDDPLPLLESLLNRQGGSEKLAAALAGKKLPADAAKLTLRHMYAIGRSDQELSDVLSKAAGIALDAPPPSQAEVAKLSLEVIAKGDPARGEQIFRRADLSCMKCHSVSQAGGNVGPDLSALGSISPVDYIVNSILNPNLAIKEQFVTIRVLTLDGQVHTGILVDRDDKALRLKDANSRVVSIPIDDIDQEAEGKSLMPQGLTKFLTHEEFLDLARFVSELGKPGSYAVRKTPGIQRWRVLRSPPSELTAEVPNVELLREYVLDAPADAWNTAYAMVDGTLPLDELRTADSSNVLYLQGEVNVITTGKAFVEIDSSAPAHIWIDAEPFETQTKIERELSAGKHTITLRLVNADSGGTLKADVRKAEASPAQLVIVNGT